MKPKNIIRHSVKHKAKLLVESAQITAKMEIFKFCFFATSILAMPFLRYEYKISSFIN